jgi:hypothetical protein
VAANSLLWKVLEKRMRETAIICITVFHFAVIEVSNVLFSAWEAFLISETNTSLQRIRHDGIKAKCGIFWNPASSNIVVAISALSAMGSSICPKIVVCLYTLAKYPSRKSVRAPIIKANSTNF